MSDPPPPPPPPPRWAVPSVLFALTFASTTYVGALMSGADVRTVGALSAGLPYSVPLMSILLAHELGHYVAARLHRVPASPPYFVPIPLPPLGTMGAIILMRGRIASRTALMDVGAAGPLAGLVVALPVLAYGIIESPISPEADGTYWMEGRSLLYSAMLYAFKGPIPDGHDIMLSPTAFAGWAGLLVTMINLIPAMQLDGGHVAHALFDERHERLSRSVRLGLFPLALIVGLSYGVPAFIEGKRGEALFGEIQGAFQWLVWAVLLAVIGGRSAREHPPTDPGELSRGRRAIGWLTLGTFVLLFMPAWLRTVVVP